MQGLFVLFLVLLMVGGGVAFIVWQFGQRGAAVKQIAEAMGLQQTRGGGLPEVAGQYDGRLLRVGLVEHGFGPTKKFRSYAEVGHARPDVLLLCFPAENATTDDATLHHRVQIAPAFDERFVVCTTHPQIAHHVFDAEMQQRLLGPDGELLRGMSVSGIAVAGGVVSLFDQDVSPKNLETVQRAVPLLHALAARAESAPPGQAPAPSLDYYPVLGRQRV